MRRTIISAVAAVVLLAGCGHSDFPTTPAVMQGTAVTDAGLTMTVTNTSL
jgi:nitrous oxide reductase accessory protein NosL